MALGRSHEFKVVIVQIVCVVEIQSESAWALTNITSGNTCHAKFHASEASGSEEEDFNIFSVYFFGSNPGHPREDPFRTLGPLFEQTWLSTKGNATYQISRGSPKEHFCEIVLKLDHWPRRCCCLKVFLFLALMAILCS